MRVSKYVEQPLRPTSAARGGGTTMLEELPEAEQRRKKRCTLFTGAPGEPNNFSANVSTTVRIRNRSGYVRHRHDFDQIRLTVAGTPQWGPGDWAPEGCIHYTPAGTYYGPTHQDDQEGFETFTVRFEGANGPVDDVVSTEATDAEINAARDRLIAKGGRFENGIYTWVDATGKRHNKDGYEACNEEVFGRPVRYPLACYSKPILIDPRAFEWQPIGAGVRKRELGRFTSGETRLAMLRLDGVASHVISADEQRTLLFVMDGVGFADGSAIGKRDAMLLERGEQGAVSTEQYVEIFLLAMPKVDGSWGTNEQLSDEC